MVYLMYLTASPDERTVKTSLVFKTGFNLELLYFTNQQYTRVKKKKHVFFIKPKIKHKQKRPLDENHTSVVFLFLTSP